MPFLQIAAKTSASGYRRRIRWIWPENEVPRSMMECETSRLTAQHDIMTPFSAKLT
jgi:hypothetical protein